MSHKRPKTSPNQLALFGATKTKTKPKTPSRQARMGSVEEEHWGPRSVSKAGEWQWSAHHWQQGDRRAPILVGVDEAGRGPLAGPVSVAAVILSPEQLDPKTGLSWVEYVDDSKRLTEKKRDALFDSITQTARAWAIVHLHADQIDQVNILQATFQGMAIAVERVLGFPDQACVWPRRPELNVSTADLSVPPSDAQPYWYASTLSSATPPKGGDVFYHRAPRIEHTLDARVLVDGNKPFTAQGASVAQCAQQPIVKGDTLSFHIAAASILAKVSRDRMMVHSDQLWPGYGFSGHKGYPTKAHKGSLKELGPCPIHRRSFRY